MTIQHLALYLEKLEKTASRNEITAILADVFRASTPEEARIISYLSLGRLMAKFEGVEFQMATKTMIRVLALSYSHNEAEVLQLFKKYGDLGIIAETLHQEAIGKTIQVNKVPSVTSVYKSLLTIAQEEGSGSVERKIRGFAELLRSLSPLSARYIVRIPVGALRLGFSDMTILDALSWMKTGDKSLRKRIEHAYNVSADIGRIAAIFKEKGPDGIVHLSATAGIPIRPQQAERLGTAEEMIKKLGMCAVEWKLDGFRAQIHIVRQQTNKLNTRNTINQKKQLELGQEESDREVKIYSRSLENTTLMFPEIVGEFKKLEVESAILDGEAIGYNPETHSHLPFQETIQRKRKHGIPEMQKKIPLCYYAFDLLMLNEKSLLMTPFDKRRKLLEQIISKNGKSLDKKTVRMAEQYVTDKTEILKDKFAESVKKGYEGIMVKKIDAVYTAGARNFNWIKFKHTGEGKLADTLDCIVMGMYSGQGKRSGFGIGAFLVGVREKNEKIVTVAKVGTGLTDDQWRLMRQLCEKNAVKKIPDVYDVPKELSPDIWTDPKIVVEIAADEITKTPLHTAGLALRFPRLLSFREDKSPLDATTMQELRKLFKMQ